MATTSHYGLTKPAGSESYAVDTWNTNMQKIDDALWGNKPIKCTKSSVSSLPTTISKSGITSTMQAVKMSLSAPYVQGSDWTITSADGAITVSGTINGSTDIEIWMQEVNT